MTDDVKKIDDQKEEKSEKKEKLSKNVEKLVDDISKLSVLELSELVNSLQDKLGVTAAVPMAAAPVQSAPLAEGQAQGGADSGGGAQNLVMTSAGENKIAVIKALREINQNWGLKEAKDMTEATPVDIIKGGKPEDVKGAADKLKAAGAQVEMK